MEFRKVDKRDHDAVWDILKTVNAAGDSFAFSPQMTRSEMLGWWLSPDKYTYVAVVEGKVVGTFYIKDNQPGLGSHIANAGYAVSENARGKGVGKAMGEFSLSEARRLGYSAMQFNLVVKTNEKAVKLWKSLGFGIIGEIPEAFSHTVHGLVNAYIMYRKI
jgi:GNAT superfamily N-acetyltransferase